MIYRFCGLDWQMSGKWRRSARGARYREELRERKENRNEEQRQRDGAYPHLFGRSLAEKLCFGHLWAENGPVRPPSSRSYYFRSGPSRQRVFGPSAAEKPTSAMPWPKSPFSAHPWPTGY